MKKYKNLLWVIPTIMAGISGYHFYQSIFNESIISIKLGFFWVILSLVISFIVVNIIFNDN